MLPAMRIDDWRPEALRLTAFPAEPQSGDATGWQRVTGAEPVERTQQPRVGQSHEAGPFARGLLRLIREPARIEWRYEPVFTDENDDGLLGPLAEELNSWLPLMSRWLEGAPDLMRLAFGAVLAHEVPDKEEGYRLLGGMLPSVKLNPGSSDFLYRINRQRPSGLDAKVLINRLSTWTVRYVTHVGFRIVAGKPLPPEPGPRSYAVRLELDINTAAEYDGRFSKDRLVARFRELVELGKEIADKGDVA